jgi:hypothetical protein
MYVTQYRQISIEKYVPNYQLYKKDVDQSGPAYFLMLVPLQCYYFSTQQKSFSNKIQRNVYNLICWATKSA